MDITDFNAPRFLYTIGPNILDPDPFNTPDPDAYEILGQSWSKPQRCTVAVSSSQIISGSPLCDIAVNTTPQDVLLLAGVYDNNQDQASPSATGFRGPCRFRG